PDAYREVFTAIRQDGYHAHTPTPIEGRMQRRGPADARALMPRSRAAYAASTASCRSACPADSSATATPCITAAIRTALCTPSAPIPPWRTTFSCAATHAPQPLIAETASE